MLPDLGKYTFTVLSAWGVTLVLLAAVTGISLWRSRRVRQALQAAEERIRKANG